MVGLSKKVFKICLGIISFVLLSSSGSKEKIRKDVFLGEYELSATGDYDVKLNGEVFFEQAIETSIRGKKFSTLKLDLKNGNSGIHYIGFLISKENKSKPIDSRTYKVSEKIDGFINHFNGVFGFANIKEVGESPFFASSGKIEIEKINNQNVTGYIEVVMYNSNHKKINMKGRFIASKKQ